MVAKFYIKRLEIKGDEESGRQLSVGIPDEFIRQYSFKEGEYVIATPTEDGILLKRVKEPEKVVLEMKPKNWPEDIGIDFAPVSLKKLNLPYNFDFYLPAKEKKE